MTKQLPKLSKAQQETWKAVVDWWNTHSMESFTSADCGVSEARLNTLVWKQLLTERGHEHHYNVYTIHPDYLPTEPDAAPVAAVAEDDDAPGFRVGDRVTPVLGLQQGLECEVIKVLDHYPAQRRYLVQNVETRDGAVSYSEDGLELYETAITAPTEPDAAPVAAVTEDDQRPTVDEARLIDTITELKERVAELEAENAELKSKLKEHGDIQAQGNSNCR